MIRFRAESSWFGPPPQFVQNLQPGMHVPERALRLAGINRPLQGFSDDYGMKL